MSTYSVHVRIATVRCGTLRVSAPSAEAAVEAARIRFDAFGDEAFLDFDSTDVEASIVSIDSRDAPDAPGAVEDIPMTVGAPIDFV